MIKDFELYHGAALARLIHSNSLVSIRLHSSQSNASYILDGKMGLYLKYSKKRMTPWGFSFSREHLGEIDDMKREVGNVIIGLICYHDGIVGLKYEELKRVLDNNYDGRRWISVSRNARQKYSIKGSDGKLRYKIGEIDFTQRISEILKRGVVS